MRGLTIAWAAGQMWCSYMANRNPFAPFNPFNPDLTIEDWVTHYETEGWLSLEGFEPYGKEGIDDACEALNVASMIIGKLLRDKYGEGSFYGHSRLGMSLGWLASQLRLIQSGYPSKMFQIEYSEDHHNVGSHPNLKRAQIKVVAAIKILRKYGGMNAQQAREYAANTLEDNGVSRTHHALKKWEFNIGDDEAVKHEKLNILSSVFFVLRLDESVYELTLEEIAEALSDARLKEQIIDVCGTHILSTAGTIFGL